MTHHMPVNKDLYAETRRVVSAPLEAAPNEHTMGNDNFLKYIGRHEVAPMQLQTKKFTKDQTNAILHAFQESLPVRILGVVPSDVTRVAALYNYEVVGPTMRHDREGKEFNCRRASVALVSPVADKNRRELWVLAFPSKQYVDQVAELVLAILDDLARVNTRQHAGVETWHFADLEASVSQWTGFHDEIKHYVRHGDVVAIGNLEFFMPGLLSAGFKPTVDRWANFGLNEMFGVKTLVSDTGSKRIVLVGARECFWGEASAHYVRSLIDAGARHILYGSKAASLVKADTIHEIVAPSHFQTVIPRRNGRRNTEPEHLVRPSGAPQPELEGMLKMFGIHQGGTAVTVPTVVGEDLHQRRAYHYLNPTCMDCENGHIAEVVGDFHRKLSELSGALTNSIRFVPVHFITDYIHHDGEVTAPRSHLAVDSSSPEHEATRNRAFLQIGRFFALYALNYGHREHVGCPLQSSSFRGKRSLERVITEIRPLLDFGYGREAMAILAALYPDRPPATIALALAMIGQKYGFLDALADAESMLGRGSSTELEEEDQIRLEVFRLKGLTQIGDYRGGTQVAASLSSESKLARLKAIDQACAVQRRQAVCLAATGDHQGFLQAIREAANHEADHYRSDYQKAINELWRYIGLLHLGIVENLRSAAAALAEVRRTLGRLQAEGREPTASTAGVWWQTNHEKGALAALFLEAALFLTHGHNRDRTRGFERLFLASLLNVRVGGHEQSEAYGEIVSGVSNVAVREALILAMRNESASQSKFHLLIQTAHSPAISLVRRAQELLHSPPEEREDALQRLLDHKKKAGQN